MERVEHRPTPKKLRALKSVPLSIEEDLRELRRAPDAKEIARRTRVVRAMLKLRDELPPLDTSITDLLRQSREEEDHKLDG